MESQSTSYYERKEVLNQIDRLCGPDKKYRSRNHFLQRAVRRQLRREKRREAEAQKKELVLA